MIKTIVGKNSYALRDFVQKRITDVTSRMGGLAVERIDASEAEVTTVLQAVQSLPFLVSEKLLIISNIQSNSALMERIEELINRTAEGVEVLLVDSALDKRKSTYKLLAKQTELHDFTEPSSRELPRWMVTFAKEQGATLTLGDAGYLLERVGAHQQTLANEISKLALYDKTISRESIGLLTDQSLQNNVFDLLDAAFSAQHKKAITLYREQRKARIEPQYILAMLAWQLHSLALAVYAPSKTEATLVSAGISPYTAKKALQMTRSTTRASMKETIRKLSELDAQIKTSADPDAGIELFLLSL
jgi:DNA polymerase III delta subunit